MSEDKKPWALVIGMVQAFTKDGVKQPAAKVGDANGQRVVNYTILTPNGNYVDIALWSEYAAVADSIQEGFVLVVNGPVSQREHNGKVYTKIDAQRLVALPCVARAERAVVNAAPAAVVAPVAAAPVAEAAPVAAAPAAGQPFTF